MAEGVSLHAYVSGRVQAVFYRGSTEAIARQLGCTGYVRNLPDGRVEVYAEGTKEKLEALLSYLKEGPRHARVDNVTASWGMAGEGAYREFRVR